ncbi:hypothetical protein [Haloferax sp. Atlit-19N]|uniref:hypothetical protein n=1 Tax=Haloferax sp. Atlit-19N TaxID=2077201 RepID=UPI0011C05159|nr:hypothetical protein [Haloferax sp. Atlit-19N]
MPRIELLKRMRLTRYRWLLIGSLLAIIIVGGSGASMGVLIDGSSDMTKVRADRYCDSSDGQSCSMQIEVISLGPTDSIKVEPRNAEMSDQTKYVNSSGETITIKHITEHEEVVVYVDDDDGVYRKFSEFPSPAEK